MKTAWDELPYDPSEFGGNPMSHPVFLAQVRKQQQEYHDMAGKVKSSSKPAFAKGGSGHMFGKDSAGPQKSGVSSQEGSGGGKFAKGGGKGMFGKQSATTKKAGTSGKP